tara:strand:+ start:2241 stop:2750 length:510 start_codon:yes stop_codon:yes gene_type:complete
MQITILAIGNKMPAWVDANCDEYIRRMPKDLSLKLIELPAQKRSKNQSIDAIRRKETEQLLAAVPDKNYVVVLDERGESVSTALLAKKLNGWQLNSRDVCLLIGGPDGIDFSVFADSKVTGSKSVRSQSPEWRWSLSPLTFPHPLVRVIVTEQLYRAWSVSEGHPYHRE